MPYASKLLRADALIREAAAAGLSDAEIADSIGCTPNGLRLYCRRHGVVRDMEALKTRRAEGVQAEPNTLIGQHDACIRAFAINGATRAQLAEAIGCSVEGLAGYCKRHGIAVRHANSPDREAIPERTQKMIDMHRQGVSMADIGVKFKMTRERVRQLLARHAITAKDGGGAIRRKLSGQTEEVRRAAVRARVEAKWGVPYELARELRANGTIGAFTSQRNGAKNRGIPWSLTFAQWYAIWQTSGKMHLRGRGKGTYCMSRLEDSGGYELGNVHVQLTVENSREAVEQWRGKTKPIPGVFCLYPGLAKPWLAKFGKVKLGFHATAEEAGAAREAYMRERGITYFSSLGRGRGYSVRKDDRSRSRPFYVQRMGAFSGACFATAEEARAEYLRRCAEVAASRASAPEAA